MENTKIDITSTAIEKGIELVGGFLEKLAGSSLEEAGLMLADKIRTRRLKNQIKIFSDAKKIAEENNISIKQINLKVLVPLLEFSSLEENETLQQRWSNLIVNYSDSNEKYESSIFPYILGQLSRNEIIDLDTIYQKKQWPTFAKEKLLPMHKANLIRLGLVESVIFSVKSEYDDEINTYNGGAKITELGKQFVECCTNKKKD